MTIALEKNQEKRMHSPKPVIRATALFVFVVSMLVACDSQSTKNKPPKANAGVDKTTQINESVTITGSGTDSDGTIKKYEWKKATLVLASTASFSYTSTEVGTDTLTLTVTDNKGAKASDTMKVVVTEVADTVPPEIVADDAPIVSDITQVLSFTVTDDSGINVSTLVVQINGNEHTSLAQYANGKITITPDAANYWVAGGLSVAVTLADVLGNEINKVFEYTVQPSTAALPIARPSTGDAPLTIQLIPFNTTNTAIETYEWDFDGDGIFDRSETVGRNQSHTFNTPGSYDVALRITDTSGNQVTGTVTVLVKNSPPVVSANAVPSNGASPLDVAFSATAQDNEGIATYAWDFEGDGTYDLTGATATTANHTYSTQGTFQPVLQVTDILGAQTDYAFSDIEVRVQPVGFPAVAASASPANGTAPLNVSLNASATPVGTRTITKYEWDFDGDGSYDETSTTTGATTHTYSAAGVFFAKVRVTDSDNQTSEDVVKIIVNASVDLSIALDTIDIFSAETTTVTTTLGGDTRMSLVIEDRFGNPVRIVVPMTDRLAGTHDDIWDGKDDQGDFVSEGDYRAVVLYELNGEIKRFDLSDTTGGSSFNPPRTSIPRNFQPFAGNPLVIDFTLNRASEVTAFMGRYNVNTRLVTFMQRLPLGKGTHQISWNGEDSTGQLIHPPSGDSFLFGIFGFTLPDNAIYVRSGSHIAGMAIAPSIFVPDSVGNPDSKITFTLTNSADVRLIVYNADEGTIVARRSFSALSTGENTVLWDGKDDAGVYVSPGRYRLGITAIDSNGFQSITHYAVQQVYY